MFLLKTPFKQISGRLSDAPISIGIPKFSEACTAGSKRKPRKRNQGIHGHIYPRDEVVRQTTRSRRSGCASLVAMMKPAQFWNLEDPAFVRQLDFSMFWRIFV